MLSVMLADGSYEIAIWALVILAGLIVVALILSFNKLVGLRQLVRNSWADVDVYLKRRAELIPNLVAAVKAYASHEQTVLTAVVEARGRAAAARASLGERGDAEAALGSSLINVLAIAESYPELKANTNFIDLQRELSDTERLIASARQYYNACVRDFNTTIEAFPSNVVAGMGRFQHAEFFMVEEADQREAPGVNTSP